jgi:LPS sulfotransferase NodH
MKPAKIFQAIEETQFLKQLSSKDRLFLVGEGAPLNYIKNFFSSIKPIDNNYYYNLSDKELTELKTDNLALSKYQAVVVVSLEAENFLFQTVKEKLQHRRDFNIPILKLFDDVFVNLLCHRELLQGMTARMPEPSLSYAIVTTPRSGSSYLCELLDSTNIAGHPSEHLRLAAQELARYCNFDYLILLDKLKQYRTTNNQVFGTKFISHFLFELQQTKLDFRQIFRSIDKFILLVRKDKLAQAVSLVVAQKTKVWHLRDDGQNLNYQLKLEDLEIDCALLDDVEQKYDLINKQEARLRKILANNQVEPLQIVYEDILEDAQLQIDRILGFLNIAKPESLTKINSRIKKMPSEISQEIIRQYQQRKSTVC